MNCKTVLVLALAVHVLIAARNVHAVDASRHEKTGVGRLFLGNGASALLSVPPNTEQLIGGVNNWHHEHEHVGEAAGVLCGRRKPFICINGARDEEKLFRVSVLICIFLLRIVYVYPDADILAVMITGREHEGCS